MRIRVKRLQLKPARAEADCGGHFFRDSILVSPLLSLARLGSRIWGPLRVAFRAILVAPLLLAPLPLVRPPPELWTKLDTQGPSDPIPVQSPFLWS